MTDQDKIQQRAEELFNVFSKSMNSIRDSYCKNFEYLEDRLKVSWLKVAEHCINLEINNKGEAASNGGSQRCVFHVQDGDAC